MMAGLIRERRKCGKWRRDRGVGLRPVLGSSRGKWPAAEVEGAVSSLVRAQRVQSNRRKGSTNRETWQWGPKRHPVMAPFAQ